MVGVFRLQNHRRKEKMAIKKSELYSSLWASCDALRGGMDASQYKDYVLVLLFVKYVSDKYANDPNALIEIPKGGSFSDMVELKGTKDIGDNINKIIGKLAASNDLKGVIDVADFNDDDKLGRGKEMVDRLTDLITIFQNSSLDFSKNRAEGDDILGDAYEYLMRHFATESGKSKGQFYTPSEVSRVIAKVLNIRHATNQTTFYDPTCGSGSLLLKTIDEADGKGSIYGQEKDVATAALARMNMILHGQPSAELHKGQSTLSNPQCRDPKTGQLKLFDFIVANPPFSLKNWTNGFNPGEDIYRRFDMGVPPDKNGDYAFLLHIVKSLKSTGKAACILPHGVLFRGNAEAEIRTNLIKRGYVKGIIGLPPNLFYGTGIPACIIVIDKEGAAEREGIFMIDAGKDFIKDGNKNRLREQDIHKIVDVFNRQLELRKYSRLVSIAEISDPKNDYNLNIPRYIDSQETEDIQNIEAHLMGGIPDADIEALHDYWQVYPALKKDLFKKAVRKGFTELAVKDSHIQLTIFGHKEFVQYALEINNLITGWVEKNTVYLKKQGAGLHPKKIIHRISEDILSVFSEKALLDKYDVYQHLMNYWNDVMQDDCYLVAVDGWKAEPYRIIIQNKQGKEVDKGWACDLVPADLVINRYYPREKKAIEQLEAQKETITVQLQEMEEEHSAEDGYFSDFEKVNKAIVQKRLKELTSAKAKKNKAAADFIAEEVNVLKQYLDLLEQQATLTIQIKTASAELDVKVLAHYKTLTEKDIKQLVVDDKWMANIIKAIQTEMDRISQQLAQRIKELAGRYAIPLPQQNRQVEVLEEKVNAHLEKMGFIWQ